MILFLITPWTGLTKTNDEYEPLTYQEAHDWLLTISYKELLDFIIAYDVVEHSIPKITPAKKLILIEGRDLRITEQEPMIINIGHLEHEVRSEDERYTDFLPKQDIKPYFYVGGGGVIAGILLMLLIGR